MSLRGDVPITCYGAKACSRAWHGKTTCNQTTNLCTAIRRPVEGNRLGEAREEENQKKGSSLVNWQTAILLAVGVAIVIGVVLVLNAKGRPR